MPHLPTPPPTPKSPPPLKTPPPPRLRDATRASLRTLGTALATPTRPGAPLFAHAGARWLRLLPYAVALVFVAVLLPVTATVLAQKYELNGALATVLAIAQTAPLLLAVGRPLQAWWLIGTADLVGALVVLGAGEVAGRLWPWTPMVVVGYLVLMVAVGLREPLRTLLGVWLVTGAAGFVFELVPEQRAAGAVHVLLFILTGVVLLLTGTLRERRDAQRRLAEQETISEAERARRTLLEERTRIARELHDVVAHHMSVITVQADSAPYRIEGLSEAAREEFSTIAACARESLTEMRRLLTVLRSDGGDGTAGTEGTEGGDGTDAGGGERAPQPGLDRLQQLVEATVRTGVPAELSLPAAARLGTVPQAVDLSAYRIVQEALANVVRHAPGAPTRVSVTSADGWLTVLVVNGPPEEPRSPARAPVEAPGHGTGHGLVGMRERVRLTGGTLDTGPLPDGGYRVAARMPLSMKERV
ncbi:sensor histidine kinase [Streptomyces sp. NPDC093546]|uniref:sensor histidine kinase n=1 Tax=Streptomyces sp. NPDC093546 TaxID=3366040 RepID=UPI00382FA88F